jgi:hypothetical protein
LSFILRREGEGEGEGVEERKRIKENKKWKEEEVISDDLLHYVI